MKWLKILFTKKRLMKSKKSQYIFNQMFRPYSKREVKKNRKFYKQKKHKKEKLC